ncbi:urease accessory UreF family protein [Micromonospora sp. WMMD961]|uniref:urease accessory protein UreF n=1 Tax=Micromonospora sp. WMMD961 TaxID=3016100 RepID=UPI002417B962|nr:urease accessory UreF family protein [Micromonospora sp. WMMD961]MDG4781817.1 urease accessory UreF family protein [Micromonospora sp. WMMD961]
MATPSLLLLVADGRFPAGAHAHSGGLEAAVAAGRVTDLATLEQFLAGRLATAGLVGAAFAAAAHRAAALPDSAGADEVSGPGVVAQPATRSSTLVLLDAELDARTAAPTLREVSRRQGRALLRAGRTIWPDATFGDLPTTAFGVHQPLVLGLLCAAAGLSRLDTATVAAYGTVTGAASAGVRLLGLDPYRVQALLVGLADACDATAAEAARAADDPPERLPAAAAPLADIHAEIHATWEVRLFAS